MNIKNIEQKYFSRIRNNKVVLYFLLLFFGIIFTSSTYIYIENSSSTAIRGLYVNNINLHNLTQGEAIARMEQNVNDFMIQGGTIRIDKQTYRYNVEDTGLKIDTISTIENAYSYGRNKSFIGNLWTQIKVSLSPRNVNIIATINEQQFNNFVATSIKHFEIQPQNANIVYKDGRFKTVKEEPGMLIETEPFRQHLLENARTLSDNTIIFTRVKVDPTITTEHLSEVQEQADKILRKGFTVKFNEQSWIVPRQTLASWIEVTPSQEIQNNKIQFNKEKIERYISNKYTFEANKKPQNSRFIINKDGTFTQVKESRDGSILNISASAESIIKSLEQDGSVAILHTKPIFADVSTSNIEDLEIATLIGVGESDFVGSPENRMHNINVGAAKYQGIVIAPEEEFSFNKHLGTVDEAAGYLPSYVIKNKKIITEYGGGLCQVSTTIFRAALNAGMEITERRNHSYAVDYYGKPGLDATIYPPKPDFKFKNNTGHHVLIQYRIEGTKIFFEIYGKDDGRSVEIQGPISYDIQADGSMKTYVVQTVKDKSGKVIEEQTFQSFYRSKQEAIEDKNPLE